jgi:hypothetical protein
VNPTLFTLILFGIGLGAGAIGSLVGLGGGFIVVPALTLLFGVNIRLAIGASIISVIATSSGAAAAYVREHITNLRIGMFLEIATTLGAITGAYLASIVEPRLLFILFGLVLAYSAIAMVRGYKEHLVAGASVVRRDRIADRLDLHDSYYDEAEQHEIPYQVSHTKVGLGLMYIAGTVSGLLGVGSGTLKVPAMDLAMGLPIKVSTATSNFMIGVTAAASAGVYFARGDVQPTIAAPIAIGVLAGALGGSRILPKLHGTRVRQLFVVILVLISADMLWKGVH